jgi:hypothetical protein
VLCICPLTSNRKRFLRPPDQRHGRRPADDLIDPGAHLLDSPARCDGGGRRYRIRRRRRCNSYEEGLASATRIRTLTEAPIAATVSKINA